MDHKVSQQMNDIVGDNVKKLAQVFPAVVKDGEVDFEALKEELGDFQEVGSEKYEFIWSGKQNAKKLAQEDVAGRTLKFIEEKSIDSNKTNNLYIEGENLEVLKLLRQNYYAAAKMIYIDPPYNTGTDFIYRDKDVMKKKDSEFAEGNVDDFGNRFTVNMKSQNRFHANWLTNMYTRLSIAKDILSYDGIIFISIDDNEVFNLKKICDEIFGDGNFMACFPRVTKKAGKTTEAIARNHDYILAYSNENPLIYLPQHTDAGFKYVDKHVNERGKYKLNQTLDYDSLSYSSSLDYPIEIEGETLYPGQSYEKYLERKNGKHARADWAWRWSKDKFDWGYKNDFVVLKKYDGYSRIYTKTYQNCKIIKKGNDFEIEYMKRTKAISSLEFIENEFSNDNSKKNLLHVFDTNVFDYSKPVSLIKKLVQYTTKKEDLIIDFFSGSGTTAQAVMEQNLEDGANRKYILVQAMEECAENSDARKSGYKTINEIGEDRIQRVSKKIKLENPDVDIDTGFKVFRTADTNIKWNSLMDLGQVNINQLEYTPDFVDFMPNTKDVDIVYELMLRQKDVPLSSKVEKIFGGGYSRTYLYADSYLVCLETKITEELIDKLAKIDPLPIKFIFRDSAFQDDIALKDETFRRLKALIEKNNGMKKMTYTVEFL